MERILVVDDEQAICDALKKFLTKKGYAADSAGSGEEAIKKVKEERPHMILLDIIMPGIGGLEALKRIKKIDKEIGIVMITAVKDKVIGRRCMKLGAYDYVMKPCDIDELLAKAGDAYQHKLLKEKEK